MHSYRYYFLFFLFFLVNDENNIIQEIANNNLDKNEMTYERQRETQRHSPTMIWINDQPSGDYVNQRTISSSSSEQLIPKEKQTGKDKRNSFIRTSINL